MGKGKPAPPPFEGYTVYGPTLHKKNGRYQVALVPARDRADLKRTTTSLARYRMAVHCGRRLTSSESVDHIDEDRTNDNIDNLQLLSPRANAQKHARLKRAVQMVELRCPACATVFVREHRQTHLGKRQGEYTACSRSCSGRAVHLWSSPEGRTSLDANVIRLFTRPSMTTPPLRPGAGKLIHEHACVAPKHSMDDLLVV